MAIQEQIEDLKRQSKEYERQQTIRMKTRRTGSVTEQDLEPDINSIVVIGSGRRDHHHHRSTSLPAR